MITHIVLFRIKSDMPEAIQGLQDRLNALPAVIEQIRRYDVHQNILESERNSDVVLESSFDSLEDMQVYQQHPKHLELLEYVGTVVDSVAVIDYES